MVDLDGVRLKSPADGRASIEARLADAEARHGAGEDGPPVPREFTHTTTPSGAKTIDRLIDAFPADQQDQVRLSLSDSLCGIVAQLLLPTADGKGRCAINEILLKTPGLPNLIREGKTTQLASLIQGGKAMGMQIMDDALMDAIQQQRITPRDAYLKANDKGRFEKLLQGDDAQVVEG